MKKTEVQGYNLLVAPHESKEAGNLDGSIDIVELEIERALVVLAGNEVKEVFRTGDIVVMPKGVKGTTIVYNGKPHLFINGKPVNSGGDVWAKESWETDYKDTLGGLSKK